MKKDKENIRIIFLGRYKESEILSGPEKVAKRIYTGFSDRTDSIFVEYFFDGAKYSIWKKLFGLESIELTKKNKILRMGLIRIVFFVIKFKPQLIHILSFERFALLIYPLKFVFNYKTCYTVNGIVVYEDANFRKNLSKFLIYKNKIVEWFLITWSDKLFFLSDKSIEVAGKYYKVSDKKIIRTTNGIDEVFHIEFLRREYKRKEKLNIVLIADSFRIEKGLDFFWESVKPIINEFNANIIGENNSLKFDKVNFIPKMNTNDFAKFLKEQDIFISCSTYEPFSISSVEAMATGVIPVLTEETGTSRFIENNVNGFTVKYGDSDSMINFCLKLKNNFELTKELSLNSSKIYDELKWEKICDEYLKNFYEMLNE